MQQTDGDGAADHSARPSSVPWPPLLLAAAVLAGLVLKRTYPLAWPGVDDHAARLIGLGLGIVGVALIIWAAMTLWRHQTTVLPNKGDRKSVV